MTLLIKHRERHPTCKSFNPAICKEELWVTLTHGLSRDELIIAEIRPVIQKPRAKLDRTSSYIKRSWLLLTTKRIQPKWLGPQKRAVNAWTRALEDVPFYRHWRAITSHVGTFCAPLTPHIDHPLHQWRRTFTDQSTCRLRRPTRYHGNAASTTARWSCSRREPYHHGDGTTCLASFAGQRSRSLLKTTITAC